MSSRAAKGDSAQPVSEPRSSPNSAPVKSALWIRLLSALVLAPPVLAATYYGSPYFDVLVAVAAVVMAWEWNRLCGKRFFWLIAGLLYIGAPCLALVFLRGDPEAGRQTVLWMFMLVWASDSGAYAFGRLIGGPRLAPAISPKKTWAGFIGGVFCAGAVGAVAATVLGKSTVLPLTVVSLVMGAVTQLGDLLESWFKRHFGVKDTSNIIPGHGGILDRVDGLLAVAVATALIGLAGKGSILTWQ